MQACMPAQATETAVSFYAEDCNKPQSKYTWTAFSCSLSAAASSSAFLSRARTSSVIPGEDESTGCDDGYSVSSRSRVVGVRKHSISGDPLHEAKPAWRWHRWIRVPIQSYPGAEGANLESFYRQILGRRPMLARPFDVQWA